MSLDMSSNDFIDIYNLLIGSKNDSLIESIQQCFHSSARSMTDRNYALSMVWYGTTLPETIIEKLRELYGIKILYDSNLLSIDGKYIELFVLASNLPKEMVLKYL